VLLAHCGVAAVASCPPPGAGGGQEFAPGEEPAFRQPQLLGDHGRGFAAGLPVPDRLQLEGRVKLAPRFDGKCFDDGFHATRSPFRSLREIEATSLWIKMHITEIHFLLTA
jgi:hypothetical protein